MKREFHIEQNVVVYKTVIWSVEAKSFEEARQMVIDGYADIYDENEYDEEFDDIESVECQQCCENEDDCECERNNSNEFLAEIGL